MSALFSEYTSAAGETNEVSSWIRMVDVDVAADCGLRPTMMDRGDPVTCISCWAGGSYLVSSTLEPHNPYGIDG
ncbi:hypothetical protein GX48_04392 [Paracoccidioides brasiliensis]|nr:hypothetical protein GX48_04392 [Paracoccidioides brasiliensis]